MAIRTTCNHCHTVYHVPDEQNGRKVRCKQCDQVFVVELTAEAVAEAVPPPAGPPVVTAVAVEPASAPRPLPRRLPPRRLPRRPLQEQEASSAGSIIIALVVVLGTLVVLGGVGVYVWFAFAKSDHEKQPNAIGPTNPNPPTHFGPRGDEGADEAPGASEPVNYEPKQFEQPDAGPKTFYPEAPIPKLTEADRPGPGLSGDGTLHADVLKKVKASTAFLHVTMGDGNQGEGSGFFAGEPGLLVTNAHVVGMMHPTSAEPRQLDVILNSGEEDERRLTGKVLGVDREADLAVVKVEGANLPTPLKVDTSKALQETMPVFVSGFPGGSMRGRNVSITPTRIDSLLKEQGQLDRVQVRSAMLPGNSGGPVVDAHGNVVGVSVAVLREGITGNASINFAVPSDKVHHILHGRVKQFTVDYPYLQGSDLKATVRLQLFDPRKRVKQTALEWWIGDAGKERLAGWSKPEAAPGDGDRTRVALKSVAQSLQGDLLLAPLPAGKVYWLQPVLTLDAGRTQYSAPQAYTPPAPLQNKPFEFAAKTAAAPGAVELTTRSQLNVRDRSGRTLVLRASLGAKFQELALSPLDAEEGTRTGQFSDFDIGARIHGHILNRGELRRLMSRRAMMDQASLNDPRFNQAPEKVRREMALLSGGMQGLIDALELPRPGRALKPQDHWTEERTIPLEHLVDQPINQPFKIKYTYLGSRLRDGREEAVVSFDGETVTGGAGAQAKGVINGTAWVDVSTGQCSLVRAAFNYDVDAVVVFDGLALVSGKSEVRLQRALK